MGWIYSHSLHNLPCISSSFFPRHWLKKHQEPMRRPLYQQKCNFSMKQLNRWRSISLRSFPASDKTLNVHPCERKPQLCNRYPRACLRPNDMETSWWNYCKCTDRCTNRVVFTGKQGYAYLYLRISRIEKGGLLNALIKKNNYGKKNQSCGSFHIGEIYRLRIVLTLCI